MATPRRMIIGRPAALSMGCPAGAWKHGPYFSGKSEWAVEESK